jgi:hypothetical protein
MPSSLFTVPFHDPCTRKRLSHKPPTILSNEKEASKNGENASKTHLNTSHKERHGLDVDRVL